MTQTVASWLCEPCHNIGNDPHENMKHQGTRPTEAADGAVDRQYRCITCNTVWISREDKWGLTCGFKLVPTSSDI